MAKLGIVSGIFHPDPGGPATYLHNLLPELQAMGHTVRVLTYGDDPSDGYGYPVQRVTRNLPLWQRLFQFTWGMVQMARWADVLYVQGYTLPLLLVRPFARKIVVKVVSDSSWEIAQRRGLTTLDSVEYQTATLPPRLALLRSVYRRATRTADTVIVPSEFLARFARGWGVNDVRVIYNGIPDNDLLQVERSALRDKLDLPHDRFIVSFVARLTVWKGVDVAIEALSHLPDDVTLVVVGDGAERDKLEALKAELNVDVRFLGLQPHDTALEHMRAADVFVLSSYYEGMPHVVLEALLVGTPVVVTPAGGTPEVVTDGENGLIVPMGDAESLAAAVSRLLNDPTLRQQFILNGLERVEVFRWSNTVTQTEALLREVAQ